MKPEASPASIPGAKFPRSLTTLHEAMGECVCVCVCVCVSECVCVYVCVHLNLSIHPSFIFYIILWKKSVSKITTLILKFHTLRFQIKKRG